MAHNPDLLPETSITKFKDQDFNSLRNHCLSKRKWFMDETFPAEASSIGQKLLQGKNLSNLKWMRPQDLSWGQPHFILEGASRFDIQQGKAGDCWFLAALGSLTQNPQCLQKILMNQSFSHQYAGIFHFRPTDESEVTENGLVSQHAYTVTGAEQIQYKTGWEEIIRLWNPWGNTEWRGRWGDGSQEWQETQDPRKRQLYHNKDDGEFWMSCQDFQENFVSLFICNQIPITLDHGLRPHERWSQIIFKNQVVPGNSTGNPRRNAQYFFSVGESQGGNNVVVSFTVMPQSLKAEEQGFPLSFQVFKFQKFQERLPPTFFSPFRNAAQVIEYETKHNFTKSFQLNPGTYVVVPSARRKEAKFLLRIFLKMTASNRNSDSNFNLRALKENLAEDSEQNVFYRYVSQGLDIDATQLQSLLNKEFLIGPPEDTFSLDECRSIVALMDLKVNGRLNQEEFARLWRRLVQCQRVFQTIQKSSRVFLSSDLGKAIRNTDFLTGISISSELLDLMTLRYSDSTGRVSFPSLVCFLIRLETMARAFHNLSKDGKGFYVTEMEWMNLVMYN
ncbi:calpain-13 isoform X3 [Cavia porcellus]|uniref:calpain-13 isoform X3 n=1 Tax=Cavia porcellus TaxID=10141 RepID=UPI002FE21807